MGRVEEYKEERRYKRKIFFTMLLFLCIIASGICISDYSVNSLMKNQKSIAFVSINKTDDIHYELKVLDKKININIRYMKSDFERIKDILKKVFIQ